MTNVAPADTPPAPVLGQVEYDGADIQANWTSDSPPTSMFLLGLFKDFATNPIQSQEVQGSFGMLTDAQVDQTSQFTVAVAQLESGVPGPWSNPAYVVTSAPSSVDLTYDDRGVDLQWGAPSGKTVATGALIILWNTTTGEILDNKSVDGDKALYLPPVTLDPNTAYAISISGEVPLSTGPPSPQVPIIQTAPSLDEVTYELDGNNASITANNGKPNATYPGLRLYLDAGGTSLKTADGIGAVVIMSLPSLGPWQTYMVRLATINVTTGATSTVSRGPFSNTIPLLVQPAEIVAIAYDGTTITGSWNPVAGQPPPAGAIINIFNSQGTVVATGQSFGTSFSITPDPPLQAASYTLGVTVSHGPSFGPASATVPVLTTKVTLTSVVSDGTSITAKWTSSGFTNALLHLLNGGVVIQSQKASGSSTTMAAQLDPSGSFTVALQVLGTSTSGPIGPQTNVIVAVPQVTSTSYAPNGGDTEVTVGWTPGGSLTGIDKWSVQLFKNGQPSGVATLADAASRIVVVKPGNVLLASDTNSVAVQGVKTGTNTASGPQGEQAPVIVEAPLIVSADYDGTNLTATWLPAGGPGATTYRAVIVDNTGGQRGILITSATSATIPFTPGGDVTSYNVKVNAFGPIATGPSSSLQLIVTSSAVATTSYDGSMLNVTWPALPGASSYVVQLLESGSVIAEQPARDSPATIAATLLASGTYSVAVRGATPSAAGPAGTTRAVLAGSPQIATITATTTSVTVTWKDAPGAVTGYLASLELPGKAAVTQTSSTTSATITPSNPALQSWSSYAVRVQPAGDGMTGPFCDPVPVLVATPHVISTQFDGSVLVAEWEAMTGAGATAYLASLIEISSGSTIASQNTTESSATLTLTPVSGKTYQFVVQALAGASTGPLSDGTKSPVVLAAPAMTAVSYDGAIATASWSAAAGATGYDVAVVSGDAVVAEQRVTGTTTSFGIALAATGSYAITVSTVIGVSSGPAASMNVISAIPGISVVTTSATNVVATLQTINGISNYQGVLYEGETSVATATGTTLTFDYAVKPEATYSVRAQAIGTSADVQSGPLTNAVPIVSAIPAVTSLVVSGSKAMISWNTVADPNVTGYAVTLNETGSSSTTTNTNGTTITLDVDVAKSYTVSIAALANIAKGAGSTAASLITESVAVTSASYDDTLLTANWNAANTNGASYIVQVLANSAVVASMPSSGTSAVIPVALSAGVTYTVAVLVTNNIATGPRGTSLGALSAIPGITTIVTSATNVVATLQTINGISNYQGVLYEGETSVATATGTTLTFDYAVKPEATYSVRAQATGTSADAQSGPLTKSFAVISAAPMILASGYDGTSLTASWSAVAQPAVTGYQVSINDTTASTTTTTTTNTLEISFAVTLQLTHDYTVSLQAIGDVTTGPPSSTANPLANSVGYFFPAKSASNYGYLFRGDIRGPAQNAISVYLSQLFSNPPASIEVQPFKLTLEDNPVIPSLPYTLSIEQGAIDVWQFSTNGIRSDLKTAYLSFLQQVETQANGLLPGAMPLLRQVIAQALPLNFAETLYYSYGFDAAAGYLNLQPGMRLRVDFESRQFVSPDPNGNLSGFTGSGTSYFPISTLSNGTNMPVILDPFLASMSIPVVAANTGGGAGVIDLQGSRFQLPYIRMFVPPTFASSDSGGVAGPAQNMVIVGAPTIALLEAATTQYLTNRNFNGVPNIVWTFFRGRATFIPEIACFVDDTPVYVSVGTTVRQLTEAYAPLPFGGPVTLSRFAYRRPIGNVVDAPAQISPDYTFGRSNDVHFSFLSLNNYSYSDGLDCFDLPVLAGDAIDFEE